MYQPEVEQLPQLDAGALHWAAADTERRIAELEGYIKAEREYMALVLAERGRRVAGY